MAREGSVAPRERVNIVFKPALGGAQTEIELPLKLLVLGDFTSRADDTPLEERKKVSVDKDNFNEVMSKQELGLSINVPNRLSGKENEELPVNLRFDTLKDFEPQAIAQQVPELAKLLELREALTALKGPLANVPAFRKKIEELLKDHAQRDRILKELGLDEAPKGE
ncbi:MAG: type VI secretion system contractile sheath small subunit [Candidatus Eisenbacteria bacterium]